MEEDSELLRKLAEKLAVMETKQTQILQSLNDLVNLFDRMVRVEERQQFYHDKLKALEPRIEAAELELSRWSTARKLLVWLVGIIVSVGAFFHFGHGSGTPGG